MLALVLFGAMVMLAITMVLAWLVYTVVSLRNDAAYISEVNEVIDHVNALAHGVQQAHHRSTSRIDRADALASAANEKGVEIDSRVDSLIGRLNHHASSTRENSQKIGEVDVAVSGVAVSTETNTSSLGQHGVRLVEIESRLAGLVADDQLSERLNEYVKAEDLPNHDLGGFAKWSDFDDTDLSIKSLRSGSIELSGPDDTQAGALTYTGDGISIVSGPGRQATKITPSSVEFGANAIRVDQEGDLAYCKSGGECQKIRTS